MHRSMLFLALALITSAAAQHPLQGSNWQATIGPDGLLRSYVVAGEEFLAPFAESDSPALARVDNQPEPLAVRVDNQAVIAESANLRLTYAVVDDRLEIAYESLAMGKTATLCWRPTAAIARAFDGEDDTMVDTVKTWYDDMVDARWVSTSGTVLTWRLHGFWTRHPYTAQGLPCLGMTIYQRQQGRIVLIPETSPAPRTALVLEILGENPDFLPPGGKPARFPCRAENLGSDTLTIAWTAQVLDYASLDEATTAEGTLAIAPRATAEMPVQFDLPRPGIYRASLSLSSGGVHLKTKHWNFCYDFASYAPVCPRPADFEAFWQRTLDELAAVPVDLRREEVERTEKSVLYRIDYAVLSGERAYAWLRVPAGEPGQRFPARLDCPPSGVNALPPPAPSGFVELKLAIHGFKVDRSNFPVNPPYPWPNARYHNVGLASKETYFYRNVYARCWRAVDLLAAMPEVDPARMMVFGGSQGGGLALITAAYRPAIALCAPGFPGLCRFDWTIRNKVGSWPLSEADIPEGQTLDQMLETLSYYDAANFAGRVKCPIVATIGWMDTVTAAGGQIAAFAQADKSRLTLYCAPWGRHGADARTQTAFYGAHHAFMNGQPVPLPRTWEAGE